MKTPKRRMAKRHLKESLKSVFGNHIDFEKDEALEETKTEIENKVQKILKLIKDKNEDDINQNTEEYFSKEQLTEFIKDIQKHYESLYDRYNYLTTNLRKKVHGTKEKDSSSSSSSSSSDSDSDNSSSKKEGRKKEKLKIEYEKEANGIKERLKTAIEEKELLYKEYEEEVKMNNVLKIEVDNLKNENLKLLDENIDLNSKLESANDVEGEMKKKLEENSREISEYLIQIEHLKAELRSKTLDEMRELKEIGSLTVKVKDLELKVSSLSNEKDELEEKMKTKIDDFNKLEDENNVALAQNYAFIDEIETLKEELKYLEETIEDLKGEMEIKGEEVSSLVENVSRNEVKLRLSNQKVKVTEQLLNETEEIYMKKEAKLREENRLLEERIKVLSRTITTYKQAQKKIVAELTAKLNDTLNAMDTLTVKFEEDYGHIETCVYEIFNEIQVAKRWVRDKNEEGLGLVRELEKCEDEKDNLVNECKRGVEKLEEMERDLRDKDEEILGLREEKMEAIRQLCMHIDYHCSRYDDLKEMVSKMSGGKRKIKA